MKEKTDEQKQSDTPKLSSKFGGFFSTSTPSTPRLQTPPVSTPSLRCRTTKPKAPETINLPPASLPCSPKVQKNSPRFFYRSSNPSSPRSPSTFSLLKSTLRISKVRIFHTTLFPLFHISHLTVISFYFLFLVVLKSVQLLTNLYICFAFCRVDVEYACRL